ncbi:MAG: SBBP repeat-containing protein, partial [candidate division WOR-3 bacterium]
IISRDSLIYGTGKTISYEAKEDWFFVRFSADGRLLQREIFDLGYTDCEEIFRFVNCPDGNFVGVGTVGEGLPPILDIIILKFTSDGDTIWSRLVNIKPQDEAHDITIDSDGNLYITGDVYEDWGQGIVQPDSFVTARYRLDGRHEWGRVFGLCDYSWGEAIAFDPSGQVLVAGGSYDSILNESSGAILCYSPEGRLNWHWRFRQENWNCWFDDIVIIEPGVCYLIGEIANAEYDSSDFLVIKLRYPLGIAEGKGRKQKAADFSLSNPLKFGEPLRFSVPLPGDYRLTAFDASGRRVAEVYSGPLGSGTTNLGLASVPPGVYLLRMESEDYSAQTKLVIVP